jgi:hypothetical protein
MPLRTACSGVSTHDSTHLQFCEMEALDPLAQQRETTYLQRGPSTSQAKTFCARALDRAVVERWLG